MSAREFSWNSYGHFPVYNHICFASSFCKSDKVSSLAGAAQTRGLAPGLEEGLHCTVSFKLHFRGKGLQKLHVPRGRALGQVSLIGRRRLALSGKDSQHAAANDHRISSHEPHPLQVNRQIVRPFFLALH